MQQRAEDQQAPKDKTPKGFEIVKPKWGEVLRDLERVAKVPLARRRGAKK